MSDTEQPETEDGPVVPPADFIKTQEAARALGMTNRWSVRLRVLPEFKHLIPAGEDGECVTLYYAKPEADMAVVLKRIAERYSMMEVRWLYPMGSIPKLLSPPN
jgi:hypothetical protein